MLRRCSSIGIVVLLVAALLHVAPASHAGTLSIFITEIYPGDAEHPSAQFIELTAYAAGQTSVAGKSLRFVDPAGGALMVTFSENVGNPDNQASILIATPQAESLFGITADLNLSYPYLNPTNGKLCFDGSDDCASWGSYGGNEGGSGEPFNMPTGIPDGKSMTRKAASGDPAVFDGSDDTDNSATDFVVAEPSPRNNAAPGVPSPDPQPTHPPEPEDHVPPVSEMYRPEPGGIYSSRNFTAIRGIATDATSGIAQVQIALRKTMDDGSCKWWTGTRFVEAPCFKKLWSRATGKDEWSYALERLTPSQDTPVRAYTAFSRAIDEAGELEQSFERGRNKVTFEIR